MTVVLYLDDLYYPTKPSMCSIGPLNSFICILLYSFIRWVLQKHPIIGEPVHLPPLPDSNDELRSMTVVPYLDDLYNPTESDDDRSYEDRSFDDRSFGDQVGDQQSQGK